jgi:hypothetical protein
VPFAAARLMASAAERSARPPLTVDQVRLLETDKVASDGLGPRALGMNPQTFTSIETDLARRFAER